MRLQRAAAACSPAARPTTNSSSGATTHRPPAVAASAIARSYALSEGASSAYPSHGVFRPCARRLRTSQRLESIHGSLVGLACAAPSLVRARTPGETADPPASGITGNGPLG